MARKIILFLSEYKEENAQEKNYHCPAGEDVTGTLTNEAPVKYLLRQYNNVKEVICIVTPRAKETAWMLFQAKTAQMAQGVALTEIPYEEGQDFADGPLTEIMKKVQTGDEVLLETTGGFRNAVMDLLLLSRVLSYTGVKTVGAVYSNYQKAEIEDLSRLMESFDLVGGMQELTSFGSVKTLRTYYAQTEDLKIKRLLSSMESLYETITLCREKRINECMQAFDAALTDAETCGDVMMRQLLPVFRKKFGKKLTTPGLIKWCIQSDMLQQAVTVYTERIPAFIMECGHFIEVTPFARTPEVKEYEEAAVAQFMRDFMTLSKKPGPRRRPLRELNDHSPMVYVDTIENMEDMVAFSGYKLRCPISQMQRICRDYLYIKTVRNMMNHANDSATQDQQELIDYLSEYGYAAIEDISAETLRRSILQGIENLRLIPKKERRH